MQKIIMTKLSKLEQRLFTEYFDDGLLDLFVGTGIALIGFMWILELVALGAIVPVLLAPFWKIARQKIVEPRAGVISFRAERKAENKSVFTRWALFGLVILITEIVLLEAPGSKGIRNSDLLASMIPALPAILIALPLTLVAFFLKLSRFAFYGTLAVIFGMLATYDLGLEPGHTLLLTGLVIFLLGLMVVHRFLNEHPMDDEAPKVSKNVQ